ncbi:unnamed protein product [Taenia asiatica]|uniref:Uncharacterized protein n=1 Tax=Taenia asiatica TaxID=60517 RepID=A0A0R3VZL3_TAEAS|nr:unnamed protein product [Taenia asiatica]
MQTHEKASSSLSCDLSTRCRDFSGARLNVSMTLSAVGWIKNETAEGSNAEWRAGGNKHGIHTKRPPEGLTLHSCASASAN